MDNSTLSKYPSQAWPEIASVLPVFVFGQPEIV